MPIRERAPRVALEPFSEEVRTRLLNAPMPSREGIQAAAEVFHREEESWRSFLCNKGIGRGLQKTVEGNVRGFQRLQEKLEVVSRMPQDSAVLPEELVTVRQEALNWLLLSIYRRKNRGAHDEEFAALVKPVDFLYTDEKIIHTDKALLWLSVLQDLTPASEYELNVQLFDLQHRLETVRDGSEIDQPSQLADLFSEGRSGLAHARRVFSRRRGK